MVTPSTCRVLVFSFARRPPLKSEGSIAPGRGQTLKLASRRLLEKKDRGLAVLVGVGRCHDVGFYASGGDSSLRTERRRNRERINYFSVFHNRKPS